MTHDTPTDLARISVREKLCRNSGDMAGADQARADWDALADRVNRTDWVDTYEAVATHLDSDPYRVLVRTRHE